MEPVPIPERMLWLPLDSEGRPVLYSTTWSSEQDRARIDYDPLVGSDALFTEGGRGEGEPLPGQSVHFARQRECAMRHLCRGCRTSLKGEWAWLFCRPAHSTTAKYLQRLDIDPDRVAAFSPNAALCYQCARYSVLVCPQLLREQAGRREVTVLCRARFADLRVFAEPIAELPDVIAFCRLLALRADTFSYAEFLEKTAPPSPEFIARMMGKASPRRRR